MKGFRQRVVCPSPHSTAEVLYPPRCSVAWSFTAQIDIRLTCAARAALAGQGLQELVEEERVQLGDVVSRGRWIVRTSTVPGEFESYRASDVDRVERLERQECGSRREWTEQEWRPEPSTSPSSELAQPARTEPGLRASVPSDGRQCGRRPGRPDHPDPRRGTDRTQRGHQSERTRKSFPRTGESALSRRPGLDRAHGSY